jgi:glutamyl-tRNA synthetase
MKGYVKEMTVRTRFAPSPTGWLHIGGARTALFNWLFARHNGGKFILRIEDTDQVRSTEEATRAILEAMTWLGLDCDEGPIHQRDRLDMYREAARKLVSEGKAYYCSCTPDELESKRKQALAEGRKPKYDGTCREKNVGPGPDRVIRFRSSTMGTTILNDLIKGPISFNNEELDDLIIERSDGFPTYNFAVVIDDADMGMTHVIRGDDHVNNTPRQVLLYQALGYDVPEFAHVPMILGSDKTRLSKRHGATSVTAYRDMGYLPEALVNYLVRLGWSHGDQEIFSLAELIEYFSLDSVGKSAAVFNPEKLNWLNQHYIKTKDADTLAQTAVPYFQSLGIAADDTDYLKRVVTDLRTRAKTMVELAESGAFYFNDDIKYDPETAAKFLDPAGKATLGSIIQGLSALEALSKESIEEMLKNLSTELNAKLKNVIQPLRVALTGKTVSPGIDEVILTLGKDRTLQRIRHALETTP